MEGHYPYRLALILLLQFQLTWALAEQPFQLLQVITTHAQFSTMAQLFAGEQMTKGSWAMEDFLPVTNLLPLLRLISALAEQPLRLLLDATMSAPSLMMVL